MLKFTRNNATFNVANASLASQALPFIQAIENIGKNASVLKNIVKLLSLASPMQHTTSLSTTVWKMQLQKWL